MITWCNPQFLGKVNSVDLSGIILEKTSTSMLHNNILTTFIFSNNFLKGISLCCFSYYRRDCLKSPVLPSNVRCELRYGIFSMRLMSLVSHFVQTIITFSRTENFVSIQIFLEKEIYYQSSILNTFSYCNLVYCLHQ